MKELIEIIWNMEAWKAAVMFGILIAIVFGNPTKS
jgi:hypothetical protein